MDRTKTFSTLTLVLLLSGCGRRADEFIVASENLTEQIILREIIVHYLEHRLGTPVTRRLYLGVR